MRRAVTVPALCLLPAGRAAGRSAPEAGSAAGAGRKPPRRRARTALVAGLAGCLTLAGCSGTSGEQAGYTHKKDGSVRIERGHRPKAPDVSGKLLDGKPFHLSSYRGNVVVVNIWGSWCAPCEKEAPALERVAQQTKDRGVRFLGLNTKDPDPANARRFEDKHGISYPSLYDSSGKQISRFPANLVAQQTIPASLVIDRQGRVAAAVPNAVTAGQLHQLVDPVANEQRS